MFGTASSNCNSIFNISDQIADFSDFVAWNRSCHRVMREEPMSWPRKGRSRPNNRLTNGNLVMRGGRSLGEREGGRERALCGPQSGQ